MKTKKVIVYTGGAVRNEFQAFAALLLNSLKNINPNLLFLGNDDKGRIGYIPITNDFILNLVSCK